MFADLVGVNM